MKNQHFYNYHDLLEIYPDHTVASDMIEMLGRVLRYYANGDAWHKRHHNLKCRDEYNTHIKFIKELRELIEAMCIQQECSLIIQDENVQLNLNPWLEFVKHYNLYDVVLTLRAIKECMVDYLMQDNIMEYRECLSIVSSWEHALTDMIRKGGFEYVA